MQKKMKKLFMFLLVTLYVLPIFSQPIKIGPVSYLFQGYQPSLPCPYDTPKIVVNKKQHHYFNTSSVKQPISTTHLYRDSIVINNYINVTNGNNGVIDKNDAITTDRFNDKTNDAFLKKNKEDESVKEIGRASCRERVCLYV